MTWDDDRADSSIQTIDVGHVRRGNFYKMRNEEFYLSVWDCTDTVRLFLHALIANIRSPLYTISDDLPADERSAMVNLLRALSHRRFRRFLPGASVDIISEYDIECTAHVLA